MPCSSILQARLIGFSISAYLWLRITMQITGESFVPFMEGVLTFAYFFLLVGVSYYADFGALTATPLPTSIQFAVLLYGFLLWLFSLPIKLCIKCARRSPSSRRKGDSEDDGQQELHADHNVKRTNFDPVGPVLDDDGAALEAESGTLTSASDAITVNSGLEPIVLKIPVSRC